MRLACAIGALLSLAASAAVHLDVAADGSLTVRHEATGRVWRSVAPPAPPVVGLPRLAAAPAIDGRADDWAGLPMAVIGAGMAGDRRQIDDDSDCSAEVRAGWDETAVYICITVRDERLELAAEPTLRWWDKDSAEVWIGSRQIGFSPGPDGILASRVTEAAEGCRVAWSQAAARRPAGGVVYASLGGGRPAYCIEAAIAWDTLDLEPVEGRRVPLAVGVNDADATGEREGQIYYPATWVHSQPQTFATAVLCAADGVLPPGSERPSPRVAGIRRGPGRLEYVAETGAEPVQVTATEQGDAIEFVIDTPDRAAPLSQPIAYPPPLSSDLADGRICLAPYGNGLLLPQTNERYRNHTYWGAGADMPVIGLTEGPTGDGYAMILETPWDGGIQLQQVDGKLVPQAIWGGKLGTFAEPRRVRIEFVPSGGYVAIAKRYREIARRDGWLVTLREKKRLRPAVSRLAGAPDVWGAGSAWAAEARRHGITAAIVNGTEGGDRIQAINDLGYLSSRYDNYVDLLEENDPAKWDNTHGPLDYVARHADGSLHMGWLTWDKKTQYYQRRSDTMRAAAEAYVARDLETRPYLGRFLDVTSAMHLVECYHPDATYGREQDMRNKRALFAAVNERGLVTGGEHGRWWAVPEMDYFEGMMSLNPHFSWPAGHLLKPENGLESISDDYRTYGLGPGYRIPFWQLVFGDCTVDYWYWGDTNGYLDEYDPALSDRKDAFNVLYGTPPMYWIGPLGFGWETDAGRARLLRSYRHTGPWQAEVMFEEMLTHEYLSADLLVQRTTFAGEREAVVNFAAEAREVTVDGQPVMLPPHGFVARGPRFFCERRMAGAGPATRVRGRMFAAVDATQAGGPVSVPGLMTAGVATVTVEAPERLRIAQGSGPLTLNPTALIDGWDAVRMRLFELDADGSRLRAVPLAEPVAGKLVIDPAGRWLELATGSETLAADLHVSEPAFVPEAPEQGAPLVVSVLVSNDGWTPVAGGRLRLSIDGVPWAEQPLELAPQAAATMSFEIETAGLDGPRTFALAAEPAPDQAEQLLANNRGERTLTIAMDQRRWPRLPIARFRVTAPVVSLRDPAVSAALALPEGCDPASVRVLDADTGEPLPAQFEAAPGDARGTLVWIAQGTLAPGVPRVYDVLAQRGQSGALKPAGGYWREAGRRIDTPSYHLDLTDGVAQNLCIKAGAAPDRPVVRQIVYSSAATGWVDENGLLERLDVLAAGPVRTVVRVERNLANTTARYARTFTFYADHFELETRARPSVTGLHHRFYFLRPGTYADSLGRIAALDGKGDAEGIDGQAPQWLAVYSEAWGLSLVRLAGAGGLSWWDSSNMGGLGYVGDAESSRDVVGIHGPQQSAAYAEVDAARWRNPAAVEQVELR